MPRHNNRPRHHTPGEMTFKDLCNALGISPMDRTIITRWFRKNQDLKEVFYMDEVNAALTQVQTDVAALATAIANVPAAGSAPTASVDETITGTTAAGTPVTVTVTATEPSA